VGRRRRRHLERGLGLRSRLDNLLLEAYGIPPDPDRTRYYRLLWDLDP
jgi:hypothetical protein